MLVAGGADKNLDMIPLADAARDAKCLILLEGAASDKLKALLEARGISYQGPLNSVDKAVTAALAVSRAGDVVALSPGAASFGMFLNEFERGNQWKEAVIRLAGEN